jgi:hypothetical protein
MWSIAGIILTRENQKTLRKTCPSVTLFTKTPTQVNPGLCSEKLATNYLAPLAEVTKK